MQESKIDISVPWYFGNNRSPDLRLTLPKWYAPFFLTTSCKYAEDYADYGVYKIILGAETNSKILDFSNASDVKKLKWPKILVDKIRAGRNDLNSIAYDLYILAFNTRDKLLYVQDNAAWRKIAQHFKEKSKDIFKHMQRGASTWGDDDDHAFVLQMWKDIYDVGFDGFTHVEFGNRILALFDFKQIDKISVKPISISKLLDEMDN